MAPGDLIQPVCLILRRLVDFEAALFVHRAALGHGGAANTFLGRLRGPRVAASVSEDLKFNVVLLWFSRDDSGIVLGY